MGGSNGSRIGARNFKILFHMQIVWMTRDKPFSIQLSSGRKKCSVILPRLAIIENSSYWIYYSKIWTFVHSFKLKVIPVSKLFKSFLSAHTYWSFMFYSPLYGPAQTSYKFLQCTLYVLHVHWGPGLSKLRVQKYVGQETEEREKIKIFFLHRLVWAHQNNKMRVMTFSIIIKGQSEKNEGEKQILFLFPRGL